MGGPLDNVDGYIATIPKRAETLSMSLYMQNYGLAEQHIDVVEQLLAALRMDLEALYERYPKYDPRNEDG